MNKKRVNDWIAPACKALEDVGIAVGGKIDPKFRGQISSFGAAVVMGSLRSAVAFFAQQGGAQVRRDLLLSAMYHIITGGQGSCVSVRTTAARPVKNSSMRRSR